jgi:hypothetical protein
MNDSVCLDAGRPLMIRAFKERGLRETIVTNSCEERDK